MIMYRARRVDGPDGKPLDEADKLKAGILSSDAFEDAEPMARTARNERGQAGQP
jgi:hypothetical protein